MVPFTGGADAAPKAELVTLFQQWRDLKNRYNDGSLDVESQAGIKVFKEFCDVEGKILAASPASVNDYAIKILVADDGGDLNGSTFQLGLVEEAKRIVSRVGLS
jgi:hypothetical protein